MLQSYALNYVCFATSNIIFAKNLVHKYLIIKYKSATDLQANSEVQLQGDILGGVKNITIQLFDAQGKLLLSSQNANTIDISTFPSSIYFIKVATENQNFIKKVISNCTY